LRTEQSTGSKPSAGSSAGLRATKVLGAKFLSQDAQWNMDGNARRDKLCENSDENSPQTFLVSGGYQTCVQAAIRQMTFADLITFFVQLAEEAYALVVDS
jgi:hypothetical protein